MGHRKSQQRWLQAGASLSLSLAHFPLSSWAVVLLSPLCLLLLFLSLAGRFGHGGPEGPHVQCAQKCAQMCITSVTPPSNVLAHLKERGYAAGYRLLNSSTATNTCTTTLPQTRKPRLRLLCSSNSAQDSDAESEATLYGVRHDMIVHPCAPQLLQDLDVGHPIVRKGSADRGGSRKPSPKC